MYISKALVQNLRQHIINHISQVKMESKMVGVVGWGVPEQGWRKGPWTPEEDKLLTEYVSLHGEGKWSSVARCAGLNRNGKSCRLRWVNYLRPGLKKSQLTPQEEGIIIELHAIWGNKWSTIARYLPGRTDNEIKNYWRTHFRKKGKASQKQQKRKTQLLLQQQQQLEDQKNHDDMINYKVPLPHDHPEVGDKKIINEKSSQGNYQLETEALYPSMEEYLYLPVMGQDVSSCWSDTNNPPDDEILWGGLWNLDGVPNSRVDQSSGSSKIAIQKQANAFFCGENSIN